MIFRQDVELWFGETPKLSITAENNLNIVQVAMKKMAELVLTLTPPGEDQELAIQKLRECQMAIRLSFDTAARRTG